MALRAGNDFEIHSISCHEFKVIGGTEKRWTFNGEYLNQCFNSNDEWQRAYRPKIGGFMVSLYKPENPGYVWVEYFTPTKYETLLRKEQQLNKRKGKPIKALTNKPSNW